MLFRSVHNETSQSITFDSERFASAIYRSEVKLVTPFGLRVEMQNKGYKPLNATVCDFLVAHPEAYPEEWKRVTTKAKWYNRLVPFLGGPVTFAPTILFLGTHISRGYGYGDEYVRSCRWVTRYDDSGNKRSYVEQSFEYLTTYSQLPDIPATNYIDSDCFAAYLPQGLLGQV